MELSILTNFGVKGNRELVVAGKHAGLREGFGVFFHFVLFPCFFLLLLFPFVF